MKTRKELDQVYKKMWGTGLQGSDALEKFRTFLEYFIPFSRRGFSFEEKSYQGSGSLTYASKNIRLKVFPDFDRHPEMGGSIDFFYYRSESPRTYSGETPEKWCWPHIVSRVGLNNYLHCFLENIPLDRTPKEAVLLPVRKAFERRNESDVLLKELHIFEPAYAASFEAFIWEYYAERFFRLFDPDNQAEREALVQYSYEYYKATFPPEAILKWESRDYSTGDSPPPWKICL